MQTLEPIADGIWLPPKNQTSHCLAAVPAHGLVQEREVPAKDIEQAWERKRLFEQDPERHTYREG